jgi:hypothetical protein
MIFLLKSVEQDDDVINGTSMNSSPQQGQKSRWKRAKILRCCGLRIGWNVNKGPEKEGRRNPK